MPQKKTLRSLKDQQKFQFPGGKNITWTLQTKRRGVAVCTSEGGSTRFFPLNKVIK